MGIAFIDLSPHMVAELRDVVDESDEKAQLVKLRFAGKSQLICTRALPTAEGFQFTSALPFLRADTEVESPSPRRRASPPKGGSRRSCSVPRRRTASRAW